MYMYMYYYHYCTYIHDHFILDQSDDKTGRGTCTRFVNEDLPTTSHVISDRVIGLLQNLVNLFTCLVCKRVFQTVSGLGRHHQATGHGPVYDQLPPKKCKRHRFSYRKKREYILDVLQLTTEYRGNSKRARQVVSNRTGVSVSNLDKWVRQREFIFS